MRLPAAVPAVVALLATALPALACSCMLGPGAPQPPILVRAKVHALDSAGQRITARLQVLETLRGRVPANISVSTNAESAACGTAFIDQAVQVIAMAPDGNGGYVANSCQQMIYLQGAR